MALASEADMPRKPVPIIPDDPYHISARCLNREWFQVPMPIVWSIMEDYLWLSAHIFDLKIHSFVLMSNHFHLLVTAPSGNLSKAMLFFMRETSRRITKAAGRINQTYGARNHKTHIASNHHFMNAHKYVYQNPIRAGICLKAEEYPYSTLHGICGLKPLVIPLVEDTILFTPEFNQEALEWINQPADPDDNDSMRRALRHSQFSLKACLKTGRANPLEKKLL